MNGQSHSATSTIPLCGYCGRPVLGTMVARGTMIFHPECTQPPATQCPDCAAKDMRIAELEAQPVFRLHPLTWPCDQCGGNVEHRVPVGSKLLCYECTAARIAELEYEITRHDPPGRNYTNGDVFDLRQRIVELESQLQFERRVNASLKEALDQALQQRIAELGVGGAIPTTSPTQERA